MLVPEMRLSGSRTRKPCSLSTTQDAPSEWPSRCTTSPRRTGVVSLERRERNSMNEEQLINKRASPNAVMKDPEFKILDVLWPPDTYGFMSNVLLLRK